MKASIRKVVAAIVLTATIGLASACSIPLIDNSGPSTQPTNVASQDRLPALMRYVEAERATLPQIEELFPGVYSKIEFNGRIERLDSSDGFPNGEYATIWFYYTFAEDVAWASANANFELQRAQFDELCKDQLFPAMASVGVTGLKSAVWTYTDERNKPTQMWSHRCAGE